MTTFAQYSRAASIGACIRKHMATPDWSWQNMAITNAESDPSAAAACRLQAEHQKAARWLELASLSVGFPLPLGNGTNGPWNRIAVLDSDGHFGIADIAAGRIVWTDTIAPRYVARFGMATKQASSHNFAGGEGGVGSASKQVAVCLRSDRATATVVVPRPKISWIEWGLTTCYGDVGTGKTSKEWRKEWINMDDSVEWRETQVAQWTRVLPPSGSCTVEIADIVRQSVPFGPWLIETREGGKHHSGVRGEAEWRVFGDRSLREKTKAVLIAAHAAVAKMYTEYECMRVRVAAGVGLPGDYNALRCPPTVAGYRNAVKAALYP